MAHPLTETRVKKPILDLVNHDFPSILEPAGRSPREFLLPALGKVFKADFAYKIKTGGWCFIEDDSAGTCLSNLLKYAYWIKETNPERPIWVFHIIHPEGAAWFELCRRESQRLNSPDFRHVIIPTKDWPEIAPKWLDDLRIKMKEI